jgi:hypothetical protein
VITGAKQVTAADFVRVDLVFLERGEFGLGVTDAVFKGLALLGAELFQIEWLTGTDADFGEACEQVFFNVLRRGEASMKFR